MLFDRQRGSGVRQGSSFAVQPHPWRPSCSPSIGRSQPLLRPRNPQSGGLCETENEAELSELVLLMVRAFVITHPILAPHGCSSAGVTRQRREYLKIEELLSDELVDAASTTIWRTVQLMLCTCFLALHKALISSAFSRIRSNRDRLFCRLNLEHSRVFVKHWSAQLIRPEEETRQAGDPT
jgi:hypothetical protein